MSDIGICPLNLLADDEVRQRLAGAHSFTDYLIVAEWSALPDARWIIQAPEAICSILVFPHQFSLPEGSRWTARRDAGLRMEPCTDMPTALLKDGSLEDPLGRARLDGVFEGEMEVVGEGAVALRFTLTNRSETAWRDLYVWVCLLHQHAPFPYATYVHTDEGFVKFDFFGGLGGFAEARTFTPKGKALRDALLAEGHRTAWHPPQQVANPLRAVTAEINGERYTVGISSPQALVLGGKESNPCTDMGIGFGAIPPGGAAVTEAQIHFVKGTLEDLLQRV